MVPNSNCPSPDRRRFLAGSAGLGVLVGCSATQHQEEVQQLDELFPDLQDCRGDVQSITQEEHVTRRKRLGQLLASSDLDALVIEPSATMEYLSGVSWGRSERLFALVVLADGSHFWVSPAFEAHRAGLKIHAKDGPGGDIVGWDEHEYAYAPLASELTTRRATRLCMSRPFGTCTWPASQRPWSRRPLLPPAP